VRAGRGVAECAPPACDPLADWDAPCLVRSSPLQAPVGVAGPALGAPDAVAVEPEPVAGSTEEDELAALEAAMAQ